MKNYKFKYLNLKHVVLLLLITCSVSCKKESSSQSVSTSSKRAVLTAIRGGNTGIYDKQGRFVILRGVNYNILGDYWQANEDAPATAQFDETHIEMMASYGFNCIRLLFNWSAVEPNRNEYDYNYIERIREVILAAERNGIYVLLDLHQDAYSKFIFSTRENSCSFHQKGWDGAPLWAVLTDNKSVCSRDGSRENVPAVVRAWQNLWDNSQGIQDRLIEMWKLIVGELGHHENVIGYDLINEPSLGSSSLTDQQNKLSEFYRFTIDAIRKTEGENNQTEKMIFFEPAVTFNGEGIPSVSATNFTSDRNIVFAPHNYFEVISNILTIEQGYALYESLSKAYQTPCFIGEWGAYSSPETDKEKILRFAQQEDFYKMGSTYWQWAQAPGDPHSIDWDGENISPTVMHLIELDQNAQYTGKKNEIFLKVLSRARPIAVQGKNIRFESNPDSGTFFLKANSPQKGITELWIPNTFGEPTITGENAELKNLIKREGGYTAEIEVQGAYRIDISY